MAASDQHVAVESLMDVNAGDEHHESKYWQTCSGCGRDYPTDHDACPWGCDN